MRLAHRATTLLGSLLVALPLAAQRPAPQPSSVPVEVALAGLGPLSGLMGDVRFTVGEAPAGWPASLLPSAPATLLGGISSSLVTTLVASYPLPFSQAVARYSALLERAGWREGKERPESSGGLTIGAKDTTWSRTYCHDRDFLVLTHGDTAAGRSVLRISRVDRREGAFAPQCGHDPRAGHSGKGIGPELPPLDPPAGVTIQSSHGSGSTNETMSSAQFVSDLTPAALAAHYGSQAERSGWKPGNVITGDGFAAVMATKTDAEGAWRMLIFASADGPARNVTVQLMKLKGP